MIKFDNLITLSKSDFNINHEGELGLISHAHTDHLPSSFKNKNFICSDITKKVTEYRKKTDIQLAKNKEIKMLDAGHVLGSKMFLLNKELLYTGDFNPKGDFAGKARPVKCKTLIIESTFARPRFVFPDKKEIENKLADYIKENNAVLLMTSDSGFGKPQEICNILNKKKFLRKLNKNAVLSFYLTFRFLSFFYSQPI